MKKIIAIICTLMIISCTKKSNNINNITYPPGQFSGTWVNTANSNDFFTLTTVSSNSNGIRYTSNCTYNYNMGTGTSSLKVSKDTILESDILQANGWLTHYYRFNNSTTSPADCNTSNYEADAYLSYNNINLIVHINWPTPYLDQKLTFKKQ